MLVRFLSRLHGADLTNLVEKYPLFEFFDRLVTVLVFVDLLPKLHELLISPLFHLLELAVGLVIGVHGGSSNHRTFV